MPFNICGSLLLIPGLTKQTSDNFHVYRKKTLVGLTSQLGSLSACLSHYKLMNSLFDL